MAPVNRPPSIRAVDLRAFDEPVDRRAARAFFDSDDPAVVQVEDQVMARHRRLRVLVIVSFVVCLVGIVLWSSLPEDGDDRLAFTLTFGGLLGAVTSFVELRRSSAPRAYQVARFASDNGFAFSYLQDSAGYEGMRFVNGEHHQRWLTVNGRVGGKPVEFGNLTFALNRTRRLGYIAMRLPAHLPTMLITARSNPLLTLALPEYPARENLVDVGAGRRFRVYASAGAEHVVRALCTPEAVTALAALAKRYTIEIAGDVLFLYRRGDAVTARGRRWKEQIDDVEALARVLDSSQVWPLMRAQSSRFLRSLPAMRQHFVTRSPIAMALIIVAVVVLVAVAFALLVV